MDRIEEIRNRLKQATSGPWNWVMNKNHRCVSLVSDRGWRDIVMDFDRWGMHSAIPRFIERHSGIGIMEKADKFARSRPGLEHHIGYDLDIIHPDAQLIAHAPDDLQYLLNRETPMQAIRTETSSQACPVCKSNVNWKYCSNCGQRIGY